MQKGLTTDSLAYRQKAGPGQCFPTQINSGGQWRVSFQRISLVNVTGCKEGREPQGLHQEAVRGEAPSDSQTHGYNSSEFLSKPTFCPNKIRLTINGECTTLFTIFLISPPQLLSLMYKVLRIFLNFARKRNVLKPPTPKITTRTHMSNRAATVFWFVFES